MIQFSVQLHHTEKFDDRYKAMILGKRTPTHPSAEKDPCSHEVNLAKFGRSIPGVAQLADPAARIRLAKL